MSTKCSIWAAFDGCLLVMGDRVATNANGSSCDGLDFTGRITKVGYTTFYIMRDDGVRGGGNNGSWIINKDCGGSITFLDKADTTTKTKKSKLEVDKLIKDGVEDVKGFVKENRYVLYWVSLILLADHFIFGGEMRGKIQTLFNSIIDTVNSKINGDSVKDAKD